MELYQMMDDLEGKGEVDFPHWWQSKIVKAKDMVVGAKHYLDFELKEPQIDAMVDVAAEEDVIGENQTKEDILAQIEKLRVASNAGEIDGDEFLDKFMILRDKLKNQTNESVNKETHIPDETIFKMQNGKFVHIDDRFGDKYYVTIYGSKGYDYGKEKELSLKYIKNKIKSGEWEEVKESVNENLTVGGKPSQEEVDKFFEETFQETHYLASKPVGEWDEYDMSNWKAKLKKKKQDKPQFGENLTVGGKPSQEELYKVAGRPVTLIKGKKADGTDWKVKFQNGKETPLSDVLSLIKPFPKLDKESVNENLTARIMKTLKETKSKKNR
jgi:hypothetical protein